MKINKFTSAVIWSSSIGLESSMKERFVSRRFIKVSTLFLSSRSKLEMWH